LAAKCERVLKELQPRVVFSDIDGTLIDTFTRKYGRSKELVKKLTESSIPVVLCSSKTRMEQEAIRRDLELEDEPFIVENGGAVIIPQYYFGRIYEDHDDGSSLVNNDEEEDDIQHNDRIRLDGGYTIIELGRSSGEIRKVLQEIRRKTDIIFRGVSDIAIEELAKIVGMTYAEAERMSKRQYGETILDIDKTRKVQFEQVLNQHGLKPIYGGRYFDITAGNDKGKAVRILMDLYRKKLGDNTIFIGIGDSLNDLPMLKSTDVAIIVQKHDGSWANMEKDISGIVQVEGIGPKGWENAFDYIMEAA
jgi:mannosyl-3-phosphoglycerate phosphatase